MSGIETSANSRRQFVKLALGLSGLALVAPQLVTAEERRRGGSPADGSSAGKKLVKPGEGMAASLNYIENHADLKNAALKMTRQGVPFEKQLCSGCMFYAADGKVDGSDAGKCTVLANQYVKGAGWCSSWAKKV